MPCSNPGHSPVDRLDAWRQPRRPAGAPVSALAAAMVILLPSIATASPATIDGVTFSDELGGLDIERVTGHGSIDDPFVIVERLKNPDGATLVIRVPPDFGNHIGSVHAIGLAMVKVVENATNFAWTSFDLELQSKRGVPSDYLDGLSFGQGSTAGRPFTATGFGRVTAVDEPYDRIDLSDGKVPIGGQMIVRFVVSESVPLTNTYLVQRPIRPIAERTGSPRPKHYSEMPTARTTAGFEELNWATPRESKALN